MISLEILGIMIAINLLVYFIHMIFSIRMKNINQKLWDEEKATLLRIYPNITKAELCEYFVMFCARNDCLVDF